MKQQQFNRIAKALADPRRMEILENLARKEEISCGELADLFPVGQSTISHHLKILTDAEIVVVRRDGQHGYFSLQRSILHSYFARLQDKLGSFSG